MIEVIGYVEVEETPVRWNKDGSMFMTADFRWHEGTRENDWTVRPEITVPQMLNLAKRIESVTDFPRKCAKCGSHISYVGRGRPRKYCGEC